MPSLRNTPVKLSLVSLVTPLVLADGLDVTFYSAVEDVWFDVEPWFVEQDYRLYDATGRRLQLVPDESVRPLEDTPTGADELAGLLRVWLPLAGVRVDDPDARTLPELLELAVGRAGTWEPSADFPLARGLGVAFLVVVAVVFAVAIRAAVAGTDEPLPQVMEALAGVAAVAALLVAAVQVWRGRRWWPWVAAHVVLITVATIVALLAGDA
jgi:hypothetical protein